MNKLLVICGPTATGKTGLALRLADRFNGELVSADSRQVYKYMNIGTGKDVPEDFWPEISNIPFQGRKVPYLTNGKTRIWGYDLVHPKEEFSVAQYVDIAHAIISHILREGKLPILVGGTGLYIKSVTDGIATSTVPKNYGLRKVLETKTVEKLGVGLGRLDPARLEAMNASDRANPRRLIRAIEIASYKGTPVLPNASTYDTLRIGLSLKKEELDVRINARVEARVRAGMREEIAGLLEKGVRWSSQSTSSIGYRQWKGYFKEEVSLSEAVSAWKSAEEKYAKRQKTWFKRDERIRWFDVSKEDYLKEIEKTVKKWYSSK